MNTQTRPTCEIEGCTNVATKRYSDNKIVFRRWCGRHYKIRYGAWEKHKQYQKSYMKTYMRDVYPKLNYDQGIKKANGEIICLLDSDDEYAPNYLERVDYFLLKGHLCLTKQQRYGY